MPQNDKYPVISIIVPVYNVEKYLDYCVESIVNQTYKKLEIILVDDGSNDNSPEKCDLWAEKDSRIKVIHKNNGGVSSARNAGLDVACGEYIGFVDSDDYIDKDMYLCLLNEISKSNAKIACCQSVTVSDQSKDFCEPIKSYDVVCLNSTETIEEIFAFKMGTSVWRRLFHRSLFEELRFPVGEINEEFPLIVPLSVRADTTVYVKRALYYYRDRSDSITGTLHLSLNTLRCVNKNLALIEKQLSDYNFLHIKNYSLFAAKNSFYMLLSIIKNCVDIDGELKELYDAYFNRLKTNSKEFLFSKRIVLKDKILYFLIVSGIYRKIMKLNKK